MPYIYNADCYCDSCGQSIKDELLKTATEAQIEEWQDERNYDSDEFPKWMSDDEEADCPQHCGSHEECLEYVELPSGRKIGALLSTSLTSDGVEYVKEQVKANPSGEVETFWRESFDYINFPPIQFEGSFSDYVCPGDVISLDIEGFTIEARIVQDTIIGIDDDDSHNTDQSVTGCDDEAQKKILSARQAWFNDEWFYCGVVLSISKNGVMLSDHAASLWGIEANYPDSDNAYLTECANEMIEETLQEGKTILAKLCQS